MLQSFEDMARACAVDFVPKSNDVIDAIDWAGGGFPDLLTSQGTGRYDDGPESLT